MQSNSSPALKGGKREHIADADSVDLSADAQLNQLGYKQELSRNRSTMHVAFMSFVLAAIPYGLSTTMYYPLVAGGSANVVWGWIMGSAIILCVAASLGEITSVYPTAGGVYYQAHMLAPQRWNRLASWICGWLYVIGNVTITLAVNFGSAQFLVGCVDVFQKGGGDVLAGEAYQVFLIFLGITLLCNAVSALGNRWLPLLDTFSAYFTLGGVMAIMICVLTLAKSGRRTAEYVFTNFEVNSGWKPRGWSFMIGLLQAAYATSSTGMIISMCEEVRKPASQVPRAMVVTVVINFIIGLLTLLPLMFVLPDIADLIAFAQPVPYMIKSAVGSEGGSFALLIPLLFLALSCGIGCTTAASRCLWAFARDGAVPGSSLWKKVHPGLDVPLNAMMLSMIVQILLAFIYFGSSTAFGAFLGVGVIALTAAYAAPIVISMLEGRKTVRKGQFYLGTLGLVCNLVAVGWSLLAIPLFCMPTTVPVETAAMNYASVVFVVFAAISAAWYFIWGRLNYIGPAVAGE